MNLTSRISQAINLAARLHDGQERKSSDGLPYISHPFAVAWILNNYTDDEDVIIAGLMHDVLEDVKDFDYQDLEKACGSKVAEIVKGVSEDKDPNVISDEKASWMDRKQKYLNNLKKDSIESMMVCTADKIHNLNSMFNDYNEIGEKLWERFNSPPDKKLWFYEEVAKIVRNKISVEMSLELEMVLSKLRKQIS